jgi:hypothetical protein
VLPTVKLALAALWNLGGIANVKSTVGSFTLAVFSCSHPSSTTPSGTWTLMPPDFVIPETETLYVEGPPVTATLGVAPPNAVPVTSTSRARRPMADGGP